MRCTAITKSGQRCRNFALNDENKCICHSSSERAKTARNKRKIPTKEDMILELQTQLRKVKRSKVDALEKSREVRMILTQIAELKGEKPRKEKEPESKRDSFEKRVEKCMKEKES
jgi:hypothetical protein